MRRLWIVALVPLLLAADKPWPQKGDTVFVAAPLAGANITMILGMKMPDAPAIEACAPLTLQKRADDDAFFLAKDDQGHNRKLIGKEWINRIYRAQSDCLRRTELFGVPRVQSEGGYTYRLAPDGH